LDSESFNGASYYGPSKWGQQEVDKARTAGLSTTDADYAQLTGSVSESSISMSVWPNLQGERAGYSFSFVPTEAVGVNNDIWV
jgi:hypothetical protein